LDVQGEHGARQQHAVGVEPLQALALDPLAALDRVQVVQKDIDVPHLRISREESVEFRKIGHGEPWIEREARLRRRPSSIRCRPAHRNVRENIDSI
jgi:hypothetical protein